MGAIATLHSDVLHTKDLKAKVDQTVQDTIIATRIVDGFRNLHQHGAYLKAYTNFPLEFVDLRNWFVPLLAHVPCQILHARY